MPGGVPTSGGGWTLAPPHDQALAHSMASARKAIPEASRHRRASGHRQRAATETATQSKAASGPKEKFRLDGGIPSDPDGGAVVVMVRVGSRFSSGSIISRNVVTSAVRSEQVASAGAPEQLTVTGP